MYSVSKAQVATVLAEVLREQLVAGNTVEVPGLGTLQVDQRAAAMREEEDGTVHLDPPSRRITFSPAS